MKTKQEIIQEYVKKNPNPIRKLCPEVVLFWHGKGENGEQIRTYNLRNNKVVFHKHNSVGKVQLDNPNVDICSCFTKVYGVYLRFVKKYMMLEASEVTIQANRAQYDEQGNIIPRHWEFSSRRFFFYGDKNYYNIHGDLLPIHPKSTKYYNRSAWDYLGSVARLSARNEKNVTQQLKLFFEAVGEPPERFMSAWQQNYYIERKIIPLWIFREFYKRAIVPRNHKEDKNSTLNDLCKELDIKEIQQVAEHIQGMYSFFVFQQLNTETAVLRYYGQSDYINKGGIFNFSHPYESERVFITSHGVVIYEKQGDKWVKHTTKYSSKYFTHYIYDPKGDMFSVPPLKYIKNVINWESRLVSSPYTNQFYCAKNAVEEIIKILRHPIIENLSKAGYPNVAKAVGYNSTVKANLRDYFGTNETSDIYKATGLNKYQLKKLNNSVDIPKHHLPLMNLVSDVKRILAVQEISHLSNQDTDFWFDNLKYFKYVCYVNFNEMLYNVSALGIITPLRSWGWNNNPLHPLTEEQQKNLRKVIKLTNKIKLVNPDVRVPRIFADTVRLFCQLRAEVRPNIDLYSIDSLERLNNIHDMLIELLNFERQKHKAEVEAERIEQLKKLNKKRKELFLGKLDENKYNYFIKIPESPKEIIEEGAKLSHCVGGYVNTVCDGSTNILFLREKKNPDKPFYTIEVKDLNGLEVVQIHGFGNKWLGNNPEAIQFVIDWLKACGIKCKKNILLCTAIGYGGYGAELLPEKNYNW